MIISVVNQKGGVGKTTIAFHLVHAFADKSVLAVDTDPQGNLTSRFVENLPEVSNIANLYARTPCEPVKVSDTIDLVGADISLSFRETENKSESAHYLTRALVQITALSERDNTTGTIVSDMPPVSCLSPSFG